MTSAKSMKLPLLPLRDIVVFPGMTMPLLIGRATSLRACESALGNSGEIFLLAQRDSSVESPTTGDLYGVGVIATIVRHLPTPDGKLKLLVHGKQRARLAEACGYECTVEPIDDAEPIRASDFNPGSPLEDLPFNDVGDLVGKLQPLLENDSLSPEQRKDGAIRLIRR